MSAATKLIFLSFSLFVIFILFSYLVHKDIFTQFDFDTTVRLQDNITRRVDTVFSALSDLGNFEITLIFLLLIFIALRKFIAGIVSLMAFVLFHVIELFGKFYLEHPPPPHFMLRTESVFDFPAFHVAAVNAYPSGHAGRTIFISAILLTLIWRAKKIKIPVKLLLFSVILVFDFFMLISRVYLGEHWATDVIGGSILGVSLGIFAIAPFVKQDKKINNQTGTTQA